MVVDGLVSHILAVDIGELNDGPRYGRLIYVLVGHLMTLNGNHCVTQFVNT